jgi:predicted transcriptional regulator
VLLSAQQRLPEARMSTTTIRLPDELKARIAKAAERAGTSPHSFILDAIAEKTEQAERCADFYAEADQRWAEFLETGDSISWEEARRYLMARVRGEEAQRPVPRKFAK